ncbi:MAG: response regulator [Luteitalea sp.]|nr:response regulator [Luteitalea sp.]
MASPSILVVDDEQSIRWSLTSRLTDEGYRVLEAETATEALKRSREAVDLILLDYLAARLGRLDRPRAIKENDPDTLVILLTAHSSGKTAVEAMRLVGLNRDRIPYRIEKFKLERPA